MQGVTPNTKQTYRKVENLWFSKQVTQSFQQQQFDKDLQYKCINCPQIKQPLSSGSRKFDAILLEKLKQSYYLQFCRKEHFTDRLDVEYFDKNFVLTKLQIQKSLNKPNCSIFQPSEIWKGYWNPSAQELY